jgi:hypothetical protein
MTAKKSAPKASAAKKTVAPKKPSGTAAGADRGYIAEQSPEKRALLEKLRALVVKGVPGATVSIKWGVPIYAKDGKMVCALAAFKDHVAINIFAPPRVLVDPKHKLEGGGKTSRLLKVRTAGDIDAASISRWLKAAVAALG